jgi:hypothetical protein
MDGRVIVRPDRQSISRHNHNSGCPSGNDYASGYARNIGIRDNGGACGNNGYPCGNDCASGYASCHTLFRRTIFRNNLPVAG